MEAKQVIVIRRDLKMRRGKEIAQGSHASLAWLRERTLEHRDRPRPTRLSKAELAWLNGAFAKVVCHVPDEDALLNVAKRAAEVGVMTHVITDAGRTEFGGVATITALAVGPDWADRVDEVTGQLKLY
jgi:peptidyl-tRNA hydrolase, PTH2 family